MMKKIAVRVGVLTAVFVIAIIVFSRLLNGTNSELSADMESATLPRVSFTTEHQEVNSIPGYTSDMELTSMRDTVTPVVDYALTMHLDLYDEEAEKLTWQVYTMDGQECLQRETIDDVKETIELHFVKNGMLNNEKVLKVTLHLAEKDVYYYTRIMDAKECNFAACMEFAKDFHTSAFQRKDLDVVNAHLKTESGGNQNGYQKVTLESSLEYVTWGELEPDIIGEVDWEIKECNEAYTSMVLSYQVNFLGVPEYSELTYAVEEFFRVRIYGEQQIYLMDYEREVNQNFDGRTYALDKNGVVLGLASSNLEYMCNDAGDKVAFVQNNELWHYDKNANEFSLVFSFTSTEKVDKRNRFDRHEVHIESIDESGNVLFYVLGYMNRGSYEGQVGVAVYFFDSIQNTVSERAFVPSKKGYEIMKGELGQFVHYSEEASILYVLVDGCLYRINMMEDEKQVLVRGLSAEQYMSSKDGELLVYQNTMGPVDEAKQIKLLDLNTGDESTVKAPEGEFIKPIGFVNHDLIYGVMRQGEEGFAVTGEKMLPMYKIVIINQKNDVIKEYQKEGIWIQNVIVEENVLTLQRVVRNGDIYQETTPDYITSNEKASEKSVLISSFVDGVRSVLRRLEFQDGIEELEATVVKSQLVMQDGQLLVQLDEALMQGKFYVYAKGHLQQEFDHAGQAIQYANDIQAVAVSSKQAYIFERGNWPTAYEISAMDTFSVADGQSTMEACLKKIFEKEGVDADLTKDLADGISPVEILTKYTGGEGLNLAGCNMEELQYMISNETPVIAMIGEDQFVLLTGYNKTNVAYVDPSAGARYIVTKTEMESMTGAYGNVFIGYVR